MKNQEIMSSQKENSPLSSICDLANKEFKIAVLMKLNELQENSERRFNKISERKKKYTIKMRLLTKQIDIIRKNHRNSELKNQRVK